MKNTMNEGKKMQPEMQKMHFIYASLFALLALVALVSLFSLRSLTGNSTSTQSATVGNATPVINTVYISNATDTTTYNGATSPLTLAENTTTNVFVHGKATDNNGCTQITKANALNWSAKVYRSSVAGGSACTANNNNCYTAGSSVMTTDTCTNDGTDLDLQYEFTVPIEYYADATDATAPTYAADTWKAAVDLTDSAGAAATEVTDSQSFEIATLTAMSVGSTLAYGSMTLGQTATSDTTLTVTNTGNDTIDVSLLGGAFSCTGVNGGAALSDTVFPKANAHYSYTAATPWASSTALTASAVGNTAFNLAKSNNGASATGSIYWRLKVPTTGVSGSCTSTVTVGVCSNAAATCP